MSSASPGHSHANGKEPQPFHVIIVAAGKSVRFGDDTPKQYCMLRGRPVLCHSIETFLGIPGIQSIHTVILPTHEELFAQSTKGLPIAPAIHGGPERMESVKNALQALSDLEDDAIIMIHDAARPLVSSNEIQALLSEMKENDTVTLACPVSDTLRYADKDNKASAYAERNNLWSIQTPQAFRYGVLKKAYTQAAPDKLYTDETGPVSDLGIKVCLVKGSKNNFKITHQEDLALAEQILSSKTSTEIRTGQGYDVHAFDDDAKNVQAIKLCGVDIPHNRRLKGHSDSDVGLHALTDALLGTIGAGDIGLLFPPSDPSFKNMDSAVFLEKARDIVSEKDGHIINVDITLICEAPKIGPHREKIIARLAEILNIAPDRVNIKATTTERLGFTGREEGIAAQALASVTFPMKDIL